GVAALFSCASGQSAYEHNGLKHGVFFHFVIEGLKGKAKNEDGEVTWDGLALYVKTQVKRQTPKLLGPGAQQTPSEFKVDVEGLPVLLKVGGAAVAKAGPPQATVKEEKPPKEAPSAKEVTSSTGSSPRWEGEALF